MLGIPDLAPNRPMNWQPDDAWEKDKGQESDHDDWSFEESEGEGEEAEEGGNVEKAEKAEKRPRRVQHAENPEQVRELQQQLASLQAKLDSEVDEKLVMKLKMEAMEADMRSLARYTGTPLILGAMDRSQPGPLAKIVEKDDHTSKHNVRQIVAGATHSLLVTATGDVYSWGDGAHGQLGHGDFESHDQPTKLVKLQQIKFVAVGEATSFAVSELNVVHAWGENSGGQLGIGNTTSVNEPTAVVGIPDDVNIVQIAYIGEVWSCGAGLQNGHRKHNLSTPAPIPGMDSLLVSSVAAGANHSLLLAEGNDPVVEGLEPGEEEFKERVEFVSAKYKRLVEKREGYIKRSAEELGHFARLCEVLKHEISQRDVQFTIVDGAALLDTMSKLTLAVRKEQDRQLEGMAVAERAEGRFMQGSRSKGEMSPRMDGPRDTGLNGGDDHENPESSKYLRQIQETAKLVRGIWEDAKSASLAEAGKSIGDAEGDPEGEQGQKNVRSLIIKSNEHLLMLLDRVGDELADSLALEESDAEDPECVMAVLLKETIANRKLMNDYTEGILVQTVRKLEEFRLKSKASKQGKSLLRGCF